MTGDQLLKPFAEGKRMELLGFTLSSNQPWAYPPTQSCTSAFELYIEIREKVGYFAGTLHQSFKHYWCQLSSLSRNQMTLLLIGEGSLMEL